MRYTLGEICAACGGTLTGVGECGADIIAYGAETDSRKDVHGKLFIPIAGEYFDGHDYIRAAAEKGAVCALTEHEICAEGIPLIKVASTRKALLDLAAYRRSQFNGIVVAVTGSAGKTTTKDMIASVLLQRYETHKTKGNFNNEIGLPLTVLACDEQAEAMVLEMGMNHFGEISVLSRAARPDICVITNIGDAHIEHLGSREGVLKAKCEIFEGLRCGGTIVLNGGDPLLNELTIPDNAGHVYMCTDGNGDFRRSDCFFVYAENIKPLGLSGTACQITIETEGLEGRSAGDFNSAQVRMPCCNRFETIIPLPGRHMVTDALQAAAVGAALGLTAEEIDSGLRAFMPSNNRMEIISNGSMTLINDTYNANPQSMYAVLDMLSSAENLPGRKVCIFGDMLELGERALDLHKETGRYAAESGVDLLIAIGELAGYMAQAFAERAGEAKKALHYTDKEAFLNEWESCLQSGDTVLIKASHGMALDKIAETIKHKTNN